MAAKSTKRSLACPECRVITDFPNGVEGLAVNWTVRRVLESQKTTPSPSSTRHNTDSIDSMRSSSPFLHNPIDNLPLTCALHRKNCIGICSACVSPVCDDCVSLSHTQHPILPITDAHEFLKQRLSDMTLLAKQEVERSQQELEEINRLRQSVTISERSQTNEIRLLISKCISELQTRERELIHEVELKSSQIRSDLDARDEAVQAVNSMGASLTSEAKTLMSNPLISSLTSFDTYHTLNSSLTKMKEAQISTSLSLNHELSFGLSSNIRFDVSALQQSISTLKISSIKSPEMSASSLISYQQYQGSNNSRIEVRQPTPQGGGGQHRSVFSNAPSTSSPGPSSSGISMPIPLASSPKLVAAPTAAAAPSIIDPMDLLTSFYSSPLPACSPSIIPIVAPSSSSSSPHLFNLTLEPKSVPKSTGRGENLLISSSASLPLKAWNLSSNSVSTSIELNLPYTEEILCIAQNPSYPSTSFIIFANNKGILIDLETKKLIREAFDVSGIGPRKAMIVEDPNSPDNPVLLALSESEKRISSYFKDTKFKATWTLPAAIGSFTSGEGCLFVGTADGVVTQFDLFGKKPKKTWNAHPHPITGLKCVPEFHMVISGSTDASVKAWSFVSGRLVWEACHSLPITCLITTKPTGKPLVISGSQDGVIHVRYAETGELLAALSSHTSGITCLQLHENLLLSASGRQDPTIRVWDWMKQECIVTFTGHTAGIFNLQIYDNGTKCVSASLDGRIKIWDLVNKTLLAELSGHSSFLNSLCLYEPNSSSALLK